MILRKLALKVHILIIITVFNTSVLCKDKYYINESDGFSNPQLKNHTHPFNSTNNQLNINGRYEFRVKTKINDKNYTGKNDWEDNLFTHLLYSDESIVINKFKNIIHREDGCIYPSKNNNSNRICLSKAVAFPDPKENLIPIVSIFCQSMNQSLDKKSQVICNDLSKNNADFVNLEININKNIQHLKIKTYQQEININGEFYPLTNANLTVADYENYYILYKSNLYLSQIILEDSSKLIKDIKVNYLSNEELSRIINIKLNENNNWICAPYKQSVGENNSKITSNSFSLLRIHKYSDKKMNKSIVHPIIHKLCHIENEENTNMRARVTIDATNGMVLNDILILDDYKNVSLDFKKASKKVNKTSVINIDDSHAKGLANNLFDLFKYVSDDFSKMFKKSDFKFFYFNQDNECKCEIYIGCATENKVCLLHNESIQALQDITLVIHEYLHLIVPRYLTVGCKNINECENNIISFDSLFHGFTDILMMQYLNTDTFGKEISKLSEKANNGIYITERIINEDKDLYKNLPIASQSSNHSDYHLGSYASRVFQIAHHIYTDNTNQLESIIKHWIRMLRAFKTYENKDILCYECDIDYYVFLQKLMNAYWLQLVNTPDQYLIRDLFFEWSKAGFHLIEPECIDRLSNNNDRCPNNKSKNSLHWKNFGLANSKLISNMNNSLKFQVVTGIAYFINHINKLEMVKNKCNDTVIIEFYSCGKMTYCKPEHRYFRGSITKTIVNEDKSTNFQPYNGNDICLANITINTYDIITTKKEKLTYGEFERIHRNINGNNNLSYYIRTYTKNVSRSNSIKLTETTHDNLNFTQPLINTKENFYD